MIVAAGIAPHGEIDAVPELRAAMEELGRRVAAAAPETVVVVTPHNVHVEGHFAVVTAASIGPHEVDRALAAALLDALRAEGLPALGVSYGGNDPAEAEMPLDWGTEVPLAHVEAPRVVVLCPARDRPLAEHVRAGRACDESSRGRRVALLASADHGHAHDPSGPYGHDPAAAEYDALVQELVRRVPLDFEPLARLVEPAKADSLWQLLVLQGAVGESARAELLAYAAPSYYGMLVAAVRP